MSCNVPILYVNRAAEKSADYAVFFDFTNAFGAPEIYDDFADVQIYFKVKGYLVDKFSKMPAAGYNEMKPDPVETSRCWAYLTKDFTCKYPEGLLEATVVKTYTDLAYPDGRRESQNLYITLVRKFEY